MCAAALVSLHYLSAPPFVGDELNPLAARLGLVPVTLPPVERGPGVGISDGQRDAVGEGGEGDAERAAAGGEQHPVAFAERDGLAVDLGRLRAVCGLGNVKQGVDADRSQSA